MNLFAKFAVFLVLAGVLAVLFAFVPDRRAELIPPQAIEVKPLPFEVPVAPAEQSRSRAGEKTGEASSQARSAAKIFSSNVKVPAIRGATNYGWVQLPRGTRVDLVSASGDCLWVRWDGTTVKLPHGAAATGAVVVR